MRRSIFYLIIACTVTASGLGAQGGNASHTIAPGMSRAKVIALLGEPATVRSAAEFTYLFYKNSCGRRCGMNDLVILRADSVVDAIFRSPSRHYSGASSSPAPISQRDAARAKPSAASTPAATAKPAAGTPPSGPRMRPPAEGQSLLAPKAVSFSVPSTGSGGTTAAKLPWTRFICGVRSAALARVVA